MLLAAHRPIKMPTAIRKDHRNKGGDNTAQAPAFAFGCNNFEHTKFTFTSELTSRPLARSKQVLSDGLERLAAWEDLREWLSEQ